MDNTRIELSAAEASLMAEYRAAVQSLEQQAQGALTAIIKLRGLEGAWSLQGNSLVRGA